MPIHEGKNYQDGNDIYKKVAPDPAMPTSPLDTVHVVLNSASDLADVVSQLADRLCGPIPRKAPDAPSQVPNGILGGVGDHAVHASAKINDAFDDLQRILMATSTNKT